MKITHLDTLLDGAKLSEEQMALFRETAISTATAMLQLPFASNKDELEELIAFNNLTLASLLAISATQVQAKLGDISMALLKTSLVALV